MQAKTKRVKYVMTYIKENTNMNEHRRVIVKLNNKNISKVRIVTVAANSIPLFNSPFKFCKESLSFRLLGSEDHKEQPLR